MVMEYLLMIMTVWQVKWGSQVNLSSATKSGYIVLLFDNGIFADDYDNQSLFDSEVGAVKWIYPTNANNQ